MFNVEVVGGVTEKLWVPVLPHFPALASRRLPWALPLACLFTLLFVYNCSWPQRPSSRLIPHITSSCRTPASSETLKLATSSEQTKSPVARTSTSPATRRSRRKSATRPSCSSTRLREIRGQWQLRTGVQRVGEGGESSMSSGCAGCVPDLEL